VEKQPGSIKCVEAYSSAGNVWQPGQVVDDAELIPWLLRQAPSAWVANDLQAEEPVKVSKQVRGSVAK